MVSDATDLLMKDLWDKTIEFHGHSCPGLAIGFRVALYAKKLLEIANINDSGYAGSISEIGDENIVCIAETDACGIDAIQYILKATYGSGSLRVYYKGKQAFSFYNRLNGRSFRIVYKGVGYDLNRADRLKLILSLNDNELFDIKKVKEDLPQRAEIYKSVECSSCLEKTALNAIKVIDGKSFCIDCAEIS